MPRTTNGPVTSSSGFDMTWEFFQSSGVQSSSRGRSVCRLKITQTVTNVVISLEPSTVEKATRDCDRDVTVDRYCHWRLEVCRCLALEDIGQTLTVPTLVTIRPQE